jgi:hypothetical protein
MVTMKQIQVCIEQTAPQAGIPDLDPMETEAFISAIHSSFGLTAVNRAMKTGACTEFRAKAPHFNFEELPRSEFLKQIEACCGLPWGACDKILEAIERLVEGQFQVGRRGIQGVEIEHLGTWCRGDGEERRFVHAEDRRAIPNM